MTNRRKRPEAMNGFRYARGDIVYIDSHAEQTVGHEQRPGRPAIIVSRLVTGTCMVVYLTTNMSRISPVHVEIATAARPSVALCDQIKTIDAGHLGHRYGHVTRAELRAVSDAIQIALGVTPATDLDRRLTAAQEMAAAWKNVADTFVEPGEMAIIGKETDLDWVLTAIEASGPCTGCPVRATCHETELRETAQQIQLEDRKTCGEMLRGGITFVALPDQQAADVHAGPQGGKRN